jgi:hypothetical protein
MYLKIIKENFIHVLNIHLKMGVWQTSETPNVPQGNDHTIFIQNQTINTLKTESFLTTE